MNNILNSSLLGKNFEKLGVSQGSICWNRTSYIAYDETKKNDKWSIVTLNPIQKLSRNLFGFYSSTHLNTIAPALPRSIFNHSHEPLYGNPLLMRIQKLWSKAYRNKPFPSNYVLTAGNATLEDAKIICLAEIHTNKADRKIIATIIKRMYQPGDVILLENLSAGKSVNEINLNFFYDGRLKNEYTLEGWDIPSMESTEPLELEEKLQHILNIPVIPHFNNKDLNKLKQKVDAFIEEIIESINFYMSDENVLKSKFVVEFPKTIKRCFEDLKVNKDSNSFSILIKELKKSVKAIKPFIMKRQYARAQQHPRYLREVEETFFERNKSLVDQALKHVENGKRVFVIAGRYHFFNTNVNLNISTAVKYLQTEFNKYRWIVVDPKKQCNDFWNRIDNPLLTLRRKIQVDIIK